MQGLMQNRPLLISTLIEYAAAWHGDREIVSRDPIARLIHIIGKGSDTTGGSGASLDLTAHVAETGPQSCELTGRSEVNVTGKVERGTTFK